MLTKESIQQKLESFKTQRDQVIANANALSGAIQVLEGLLADMDKPVEVPGPKLVDKE